MGDLEEDKSYKRKNTEFVGREKNDINSMINL